MVAVKGLDKGFGRGGTRELGASSSSSLSSFSSEGGGGAAAKIFSLDNSASSSSLSSSTLSHGRSSSSFTGSAASTSSAWREKDIGKGRESGGSPSYVQSPSSSIDLSSSSPSFKSSLSSNNSNYYGGGSSGSSQEPRESETGERERDTAAAEGKDAEGSISTGTAAARSLSEMSKGRYGATAVAPVERVQLDCQKKMGKTGGRRAASESLGEETATETVVASSV